MAGLHMLAAEMSGLLCVALIGSMLARNQARSAPGKAGVVQVALAGDD